MTADRCNRNSCKRPPTPGLKTCRVCRGRQSEQARIRREQHATNARFAGNCLICFKRPKLPEGTACQECRDRLRARKTPDARERDRRNANERAAARIAAGLCPKCGDRPPVRARRLCMPCQLDQNQRSARYRAKKAAANG
jgi:hypothetical protein